ncbi:MAG: hypothetical protein ACI4N3_01315 [Alphaproteobacteria bacterium]
MYTNLKYISIIVLSLIIFETNVSAQKKKVSKKQNTITGSFAKRGSIKRNLTETPKKEKTEEIIQEETTTTATPSENTDDIQAEIEKLTAQNNLIRNNINEKQTKINDITSKINDLEDSILNLETQQNKSKSACTQLSIKKMEEIQGWLIASVASSGVGTAANTTATITSFMQKDNSQIDKQNQKALDRATDKAKNQEIKKLKEEQKKISDQIKDNNEHINILSIGNGDEIDNIFDSKGIDYLTEQNRTNNEKFNEYEDKINDIQNNPFTGEVNAKNTSYEQQQKKNKTLSTVSNISSIVGTVASGAATITSTVAAGLISTIAKQVKSCKGTF